MTITGCNETATDPAIRRAESAAADKTDILIGAAAAWENGCDSLWNGIHMAVQEVNLGKGVLGRKLKVLKRDDEMDLTRSIHVAKALADNPNLVAVLGHWHSFLSESTSLLYDHNGIVNISFAGSDRLTKRGLKKFFRLGTTHDQVAEHIAQHLFQDKVRRVAIFNHVRDMSNLFADAFEREAGKYQVSVVERFKIDSQVDPEWLQQSLDYLKNTNPVDALFFAGGMPMTSAVIKGIRDSGCTLPIYSGRELTAPEFLRQVGSAAYPINIATLFPPEVINKDVEDFMNRYRQEFGSMPNESAALGYDSVMVLVKALEEAGSPDPTLVAAKLHALRNWKGVTGTFGFDAQGNSTGRAVAVQPLLKQKQ